MENLNKARDDTGAIVDLDMSEGALARAYEMGRDIIDWHVLGFKRCGDGDRWNGELALALDRAGFTEEEAGRLARAQAGVWRGGFDYGYLVNRYVRMEGKLDELLYGPTMGGPGEDGAAVLVKALTPVMSRMRRAWGNPDMADDTEFEAVWSYLEAFHHDPAEGRVAFRIGDWPSGHFLVSYGKEFISQASRDKFRRLTFEVRED